MEKVLCSNLNKQPIWIQNTIMSYSHPRLDVINPMIDKDIKHISSKSLNYKLIKKIHKNLDIVTNTNLNNLHDIDMINKFTYLFRIINTYSDIWMCEDKRKITYYDSQSYLYFRFIEIISPILLVICEEYKYEENVVIKIEKLLDEVNILKYRLDMLKD